MRLFGIKRKKEKSEKKNKSTSIERIEPINTAIGPGSMGFGSDSLEIDRAIEENNRKNRV